VAEEFLDDLMGGMAGCFRRWEPRVAAKKYVRALMSDLPRKNCWTIAEHAGDATPGKMQHLLERAKWDTMAAMREVRAFVCDRLEDAGRGDGDTVAILDESGQCKKGTATVGVKRQYVGCAGRVENAINIVYCSYATREGHALVGARPYLPREWADDAVRRRAAGVPDGLEFETKPELGRRILADLHAEDRLPPWVTGDEVYGRDPRLRAWLEDPDINTGYVMGVAASTPITFTTGKPAARADSALKTLIASDWVIDSCGAGSKGERYYAWAWIGTASPRHHLLIRRSLTPNAKGVREVAFYLCFVPEGRPATLRTLIKIAGRRWPVEEDFQVGKDAFGLDHSQVRTYPALLRHLVLSMAALAVCAITAARARTSGGPPPSSTGPDDAPPADPGLIHLTVTEVKRLVNLLTRSWHSLEHHLHWHTWRRRHQARARWFHQRTRLTQQ
jgi:SRSO17 transposase